MGKEKDNKEIWKDVIGFDGDYQVSTFGRVKSFKSKTPIIRSQCVSKRTGYAYVDLCKNGKVFNKTVHRLVAEAFIPNPEKLPEVNHKDEDKTNNQVDNLEWCTSLYNLTYGTHVERGKETRRKNGTDMFLYEYSLKNRDYITKRTKETQGKRVAKIDKNTGDVLKAYDTIADTEKENKCSHISECIRNVRNECGGYIWQSVDDIASDKNCIKNAMKRIKDAKTQNRKGMNKGKLIVQCDLEGNVINRFNSIKEARESTGCKEEGISACIHDRQKTSSGFKWKLE